MIGKDQGPKPELTKKGVVVVEKYECLVDLLDPPQINFLIFTRWTNN